MASIRPNTLKDGSRTWTVYYRDPEGGNRERTFKRKADAARFAAAVETAKAKGEFVDPRLSRMTFATWAEEHWLPTKAHRKPKTTAGYRSLLNRHVLPAFGGLELRQITTQAVRRWLADRQAEGLSPSRVRQAYLVLSGALDAAVDDDRLARNPARVARKDVPADRTREMRWLDHDEVDRLVAVVDEQWQTLLVTLAYTGLRWGEAAALRRGRCHLLRRQLHVVESLSEVGGDLTFAEPKSKKSVRWVDLPEFLVERLAEHLRHRVPDDPESLVFTSPEGAPLRHSNFYKRVWRPAVEAARLPDDVRIHDLRHSAASFMARAGYPLEWVGKQLGHSSITVTEQYRHFYPEQGVQLAGLLDAEYRAAQQGVGVSLGSGRGEVVELTGS